MNPNEAMLTHPFLHRDFVVVADGVFTQEVELHHILLAIILWIEFDVFHSQRAAAHRVGSLSFLLLITRSQSQLERVKIAGLKVAHKDTPPSCSYLRLQLYELSAVAMHLTLSIK